MITVADGTADELKTRAARDVVDIAVPDALFIFFIAGAAQAAQGLGVPFSFLSSTFIPPDIMPAVLQPIADVVGSLLWRAVLVFIFTPLALRSCRRT